MEPLNVAKILGCTLDSAVRAGASDIHLIAMDGALKIDYRIAQEIQPHLFVQSHAQEFIRRIKALARMNITDEIGLQEGVFTWQTADKTVKVRVSSVPVIGGESVVLRLMYPLPDRFALHRIGLATEQYWTLVHCLHQAHGLILVAGKTGVGKTTTLYAMMQYLAEQNRQVFSIEDPVEFPLPFIRQIEVRERVGVTYEASLRALLRQDPDVLMIGEIRDSVTARAALRSALTGRLVLATTHAKDGHQAMDRLIELGMPAELLRDILQLVVIQDGSHHDSTKSKFVLDTFTSENEVMTQYTRADEHAWIRRSL